MTTKTGLRKLIAKTLNSMDQAEIQRQSREVYERLINHEKFKRAKLISLYLSTNLEVSTIEILKHALEVGGKRCFVPHIVGTTSYSNKQLATRTRMVMVELKSMRQYDELQTNRFGIKEMLSLIDENDEQLKVADPKTDILDLVIVPGVAFSLDGRRLGHGKGYYDEFLKDWQQHSPNSSRMHTIGLALREQLVDDPLAIDGEDFKLDEILAASNV